MGAPAGFEPAHTAPETMCRGAASWALTAETLAAGTRCRYLYRNSLAAVTGSDAAGHRSAGGRVYAPWRRGLPLEDLVQLSPIVSCPSPRMFNRTSASSLITADGTNGQRGRGGS
jgi:hypothetical protein